MSTRSKSFFNTNPKFPLGNIIVYESGNALCCRIVDKANTWYWTQRQSFKKPIEVTEVWGVFLLEHPMEEPGLIEEFSHHYPAFKYVRERYPKQQYLGGKIKWEIRRLQ